MNENYHYSKMEQPQNCNFRRKILNVVTASILTEIGFDTADKPALETLTEILQSFIIEVGQNSKNYCELTGRVEPVIGDVILGLIGMGISVHGIEQYAKRNNKAALPALQQTPQHKQYNMLQAGTKQQHPNHIPNHLPPFPDPHAYIRTPTHKQPVTEYEAIREKSAAQKRDIERALTRFLAKTNDTHNLFDSEDNHMFPLIACKAIFPPYLNALLPQDQIFDPEDLEYEAQVETTEQPPRKRIKTERKQSENAIQSDGNDDSAIIEEVQKIKEEIPDSNWDIDNPYLAATKMPSKGNGD